MAVGYNGSTEHSATRAMDGDIDGAAQWSMCLWAFPNIVAAASFYSYTNNVTAPFIWEAALDLTGAVNLNVETAGAAVTSAATAGSTITNGSWWHLAVVYDGKGSTDADKIKVYVNGVAKTLTFAGATATGTLDTMGSSRSLFFGTREDGTQRWGGYLFNPQMWDIPLTNSEVIQSMLSVVPPRTDRIRYWATFTSKDDPVVYTNTNPAGVGTNTQLTHSTSTADTTDPLFTVNPLPLIPHMNTRRGMVNAARMRRNAQKRIPFSRFPGFHKGM